MEMQSRLFLRVKYKICFILRKTACNLTYRTNPTASGGAPGMIIPIDKRLDLMNSWPKIAT